MPRKLKFLLGFLTVIALLTVFRVGSVFIKIGGSDTANISDPLLKPATTEINALTIDSDHDGLPDREEILYSTNPFKPDTDGDGYLDGEEITTGHDPLDSSSSDKTGPGDPSAYKNPNLTDRVANLTVASILNDNGEIDPEQVSDQDIINIVQGVQTQAALSLFIEPIKDSDINISNDNSSESIRKYLGVILPIVEENILSPIKTSATTGPNGFDGFFDYYRKANQALKLVEVPSSWKEIHKDTLGLLLTIVSSSEFLTDDAISTDPIKATYALQQLKDAFSKFYTVLIKATALAKSQNISTEDPIFELLKK